MSIYHIINVKKQNCFISGNDGGKGEPGSQGPEGGEGPAGSDGPEGPAGPTGARGLQGRPGSGGPTGIRFILIRPIQSLTMANGCDMLTEKIH